MKLHNLLFCTVLCLIIVIFISYSTLRDIKDVKVSKQIEFRKRIVLRNSIEKNTTNNFKDKNINMKYILLWTDMIANVPFVYMGEGQKTFLSRNCTYINCFATNNKSLLGSYSKFDVIVFSGPEINFMSDYPVRRSVQQKYVFASIESAAIYGIDFDFCDEYFNWTWTYKLDSDVRWGYIVIRDSENNIIGPKIDMNWLKLEEMDPVTDDFKQKLKTKRRAAAWFVSNCQSQSGREQFVNYLRRELYLYKLYIDVYGDCGVHVCSREYEELCDRKIASEYYFYLSFENAFSEDYVTEKLIRALKNDAVPIVLGGANYTRFMPDGIYLNALDLGVKKLAAKMNELIENPDEYVNYFRWKNHYKYEKTNENVDTNEYCRMCAILNDEEAVKKVKVYHNFRQWWNPKVAYNQLFGKKMNYALAH